MSYFDLGKNEFSWIAAPVKHSLQRQPGCAQCGRFLETNSAGIFALFGRCDDCSAPMFDGEDVPDDLEY